MRSSHLPDALDGKEDVAFGVCPVNFAALCSPGAVPGVLSEATSERRSRDNATGDAPELHHARLTGTAAWRRRGIGFAHLLPMSKMGFYAFGE
jgi:hypothetical protein